MSVGRWTASIVQATVALLPLPGDAQQGLEPVAPPHALGQLGDGGRLVPGRGEIGDHLGTRAWVRWYRDPVTIKPGPARSRSQAQTRSISVSRAAGPSLLSTHHVGEPAPLVPVDLGRHPGPGILLAEPPVLDQAGHGHVLGRVHHHDGVQLEPVRGDDAEQGHVEHHDLVVGTQGVGPLRHDLADDRVGELVERGQLRRGRRTRCRPGRAG